MANYGSVIDAFVDSSASGDREEKRLSVRNSGCRPVTALTGPGEYESFAGAETVEVAEDELDEFKAPGDPAP